MSLYERREGLAPVPPAGIGVATRSFADGMALTLVTLSAGTGGYVCRRRHQTRAQRATDRADYLGHVVMVGSWALNRWGARKLDRRIQELQAMEGGNE